MQLLNIGEKYKSFFYKMQLLNIGLKFEICNLHFAISLRALLV